MNREDVIRMAREAGIVGHFWPELERFAALVAAAEREACAKVVEDEDVAPTDDAVGVQWCIAKAICARGQA